MSFLPASLESLLGGAGTAVCYPTLKKTLQGEGEPLKAFLLIIQQPELPAAPVGAGRQALARAPRLGLAGLGEGLVPGGAGSLAHGWGGGLALQPGLRLSWSHSCPLGPLLCSLGLWKGRGGAGQAPRARMGCPGQAREGGQAHCPQEKAQAA